MIARPDYGTRRSKHRTTGNRRMREQQGFRYFSGGSGSATVD
jgi:hypothetical protein